MPTESLLGAFHRTRKRGAFAVQLTHDNRTRHVPFSTKRPSLLCLRLHPVDPVQHDQRRIRGHQSTLGFMQKHVKTWRIDEIDLMLVPFERGQSRLNGELPRPFFLVKVGGGSALIDLGDAVDGTSSVQEGRGELGLASVQVADQSNITEISSGVDLHGDRDTNTSSRE